MSKAFSIAVSLIAIAGAMSAAKPSSAEPDAVILLHGLGRGPLTMKLLEWRLEQAELDVHNLGYPSDAESLDVAVDLVYQRYLSCCRAAPTVHFVTHSLGGLVLRRLTARHDIPNAGRAVMLAPPNHGSEIVDELGDVQLFEQILGPLAPQLGTGDDDLPAQLPAPSMPFGVIAGSDWINPLGPILLPEPHDGTVSVESTRLEGMSDHIVVPSSHTFLMNSPYVTDQILAFLRNGSFEQSAGE